MSNNYPGRLIREGEQDKNIVSAIQKRLIEVGCVTDLNKDGRPETLSSMAILSTDQRGCGHLPGKIR